MSAALTDFLDAQRATLAAMDAGLVPVADEVRALAEGGKRLRPAFAYWGWRGASGGAGEDEAAVLRAVAALEFVHASALVHDDVMDGAQTRRGRPATHIGFAARHGGDALERGRRRVRHRRGDPRRRPRAGLVRRAAAAARASRPRP